uniref:Fe(3+) ABC transporter substrate-binding protein n=1 Tax=Caldilinea aerophila TaxID=133453 RepID=A0A7C1JZN3_9CHLR
MWVMALLSLALVLSACAPVTIPVTPAAMPQTSGTASEGASQAATTPVVYVYSARHYGLIEPAFVQFTEETGIEVRFTFGSDTELLERLKAEGRFTPADVLFTVDAGNLWLASEEGLLRPIESEVLEQNIPDYLQDPENRWFALSLRARTIMYHPERVSPEELSTYEALADPKWKNRLCFRPSTKVYTQSLVASLIKAHGEEKAREIVAGWVANNPTYIDSDTRILETIAAGGCDVAITNHYYLARLLNENPEFPVKPFWANQDDRGVHVNVSGVGVTTHARNAENAIRLLEWLSSPAGQRIFADGNFEYPAVPEVEPHPLLASWGTFKIDTVPVSEFGRLQAAAIKLMDEVGYE